MILFYHKCEVILIFGLNTEVIITHKFFLRKFYAKNIFVIILKL